MKVRAARIPHQCSGSRQLRALGGNATDEYTHGVMYSATRRAPSAFTPAPTTATSDDYVRCDTLSPAGFVTPAPMSAQPEPMAPPRGLPPRVSHTPDRQPVVSALVSEKKKHLIRRADTNVVSVKYAAVLLNSCYRHRRRIGGGARCIRCIRLEED